MNQRIRELRKHLGLSQQEFADRISLSRGYLANIEVGNQEVQERTIKLICQEFNVNEQWLRTGEGEMFKTEEELLALLGLNLDNLDEMDRKIISEYLKLSPKQRSFIKDFIKKVVF